jgi:hypothetical protein
MSRTPPELNDIERGFHAAHISLATTRDMSAQQPPQLTPSALFEDQARLDSLRLETYNRILTAVHQKIKFASQKPGNQMTYFDVPEWQPGCPRYDVKDCILYVVWNLRHAGFKVIYMPYNRIVINWQEQSMRYYQEESPIRQAMIAAASHPPPAVSVAKPEKKRAAAYKPTAEGVAGMLSGSGNTGRRGGGGSGTITFI